MTEEDLSKFPVELSSLLCEVLEKCAARLELISVLPALSNRRGSTYEINIGVEFLRLLTADKEKLRNERCDLLKILRDVIDEIKSSGDFKTLIKHVDESCWELLSLHNLFVDCQKLKKDLRDLKETNEENLKKQEKEEVDRKLFESKTSFYQQSNNTELIKSYVTAYIESQIEQCELKFILDEENLKHEQFHLVKSAGEIEDVNRKVCAFHRRTIKELNEEIASMSRQYDSHMQELREKLELALTEKRKLFEMIQKEHEEFAQRDSDMKAYQEMKRKKAAEEKLRELHSIKIVVIQAWWRGFMVRRCLGKFKAFKARAKAIKKEFRVARALRRKKKNKK